MWLTTQASEKMPVIGETVEMQEMSTNQVGRHILTSSLASRYIINIYLSISYCHFILIHLQSLYYYIIDNIYILYYIIFNNISIVICDFVLKDNTFETQPVEMAAYPTERSSQANEVCDLCRSFHRTQNTFKNRLHRRWSGH